MRPPRLLPVLAAGALVLAACGDDDTSSTADSVAVQADPPADAAPADDSAADTAAPEAEPVNDEGTGDTESGDDVSDDVDAGSADSAGEPAADEPAADDAAAPGLRSTRLDDGRIDLIGPDVDAAADVESNLLPSVVVDDLQTGAKVNFRNVAPQNLPILLWMYAPH